MLSMSLLLLEEFCRYLKQYGKSCYWRIPIKIPADVLRSIMILRNQLKLSILRSLGTNPYLQM